jgi:hypothetical protein
MSDLKLPRFLILGARKWGIRTLHDILKLHTEISLSGLKAQLPGLI